ncbi:hypothetical protein BKA65DRAFT_77296 [Rhexocercosporidium sp. MPI-PUGE-AT-0058]|nr:hypothetical protein BKA65DRAFT_77296 [Rhexocercosporidium sp. MPI-PUGE-AT-0058]
MAEQRSLDDQPKKCHDCGRSFSRTEHLHRHRKTHTQDFPFSCPHCHRRFQRSDVQQRHVVKYCPQRQLDTPDTTGDTQSRTKIACDFCHSKKIKCCGSNPCAGCQKANRECTYLRGKASSRIAGEDLAWQPSLVPLTVASDAPLSHPSWPGQVNSGVIMSSSDGANESQRPSALTEPAAEILRHSRFSHLQRSQDPPVSLQAIATSFKDASTGNKCSHTYPSVHDPSNSSSQSTPYNFEILCRTTESGLQSSRLF